MHQIQHISCSMVCLPLHGEVLGVQAVYNGIHRKLYSILLHAHNNLLQIDYGQHILYNSWSGILCTFLFHQEVKTYYASCKIS